LAENKIAPYSADLAPCNFFLLPKMRINLKGRRFDTVEEIQADTQTVLNTLNKGRLPGFISKVVEKLESVCAVPRGLL
jgi:hypothetical protein